MGDCMIHADLSGNVRRMFHRDVVASWLSIFSKVGLTLLLMPYVLSHYPSSESSLWIFLMSITTFQIAADFGFSQTAIRYYGAAKNDEYFCKIYFAFKKQYRIIAVISFVLMLGVTYFPVVQAVAHIEAGDEYWFSWFAMVMLTAVIIYGNLYSSALFGVGRIYQLRMRETLFNIVALFVMFVMLYFEIDLSVLAVVAPLASVVNVVFNRIDLLASKGVLKIEPNCENENIVGDIWSKVWRSGLGVLFSFLILQFIIMAGVVLLEPSVSAGLTFQIRLIMLVSLVSQVPFYTKIPKMAEMFACGDFSGVKGLVREKVLFSSFLYVIACVFVFVIFSFSYTAAFFSSLKFNIPVWILFSMAFFLERLGAMRVQVYSLTNIIVWHIFNFLILVSFLLIFYWGYSFGYGLYAFPGSLLIVQLALYTPLTFFIYAKFWNKYAKN